MIIDRVNELTNNIYQGFIIKKAQYNIAKNLLDITLVFPEKYYKTIKQEDKQIIKDAFQNIVGEDIYVKVLFEYSFTDNYLVKNTVIKFLSKTEPLYCNNITEDDISVIAKETEFIITLVLDSGSYNYFKGNGFESNLKKYLKRHFTQDAIVKFMLDTSKDAKLVEVNLTSNIFKSSATSRTISIDNATKLIGRAFLGTPSYIVDLKDNPTEQVIACGKVSNIFTKKLENKNKDKQPNDKKEKESTLLKFNLNDTTGSINVVKFDRSKNEEYLKLQEGMEVVVQGKVSINSYDEKLQMIANNISTCTIDYTSINLEPVYNTASPYYLYVQPEKYVDISQTNLFEKKEPIPEFLQNKTFVAFDLETTGLTASDKIIEIGAVKMVDGEFTEIFNVLVNPEMHIPEKASAVNNIFDSDVANERTIEEVFPDFYKFIEGYPLIAQNIQFDFGYISAVAKRMNYKLDNEQFDTMVLAKKYIKIPKYNLGALCKYYDIDIGTAHRACYDAVACAKVFKKLVKYFND